MADTKPGLQSVPAPARRPAAKLPPPTAESQPHFEVRNGYTYRLDPDGRTREVSGALHVGRAALRSRQAQAQAGGPDRRPTGHGGHYIAARFDGPTDAFNHFAQDGDSNTGVYRVMEDHLAKALRRGVKVAVDIVPSYAGASKRPDELLVYFKIGETTERRRFHNEPHGKPRH